MVIGKPNDLLRFTFEVLPSLAKGTLQISNQSLVGWLARIFLPETNLLDFSIGLGGFQMLALPLALILILLLWSRLRNRGSDFLGVGVVDHHCFVNGSNHMGPLHIMGCQRRRLYGGLRTLD